jgi:hypothetical protein
VGRAATENEAVYNLAKFTMADMARCSSALRARGVGGFSSMEDVAGTVVRHLYEEMHHGEDRACALVRLYKTHPLQHLRPAEQEFATKLSKHEPLAPETRCLTLLATAGDEPAWNHRSTSAGHRAIPLPTEHVISSLPMIAQLVSQLGVSVASVVRPDSSIMVVSTESTFNVFHVPEAHGSPYIPAQDFVERHRIRSVIGFGGLFPNGDLFALIMFTKVPVSPEVAELFKPVALSVKVKLLPYAEKVFS